MFDEWQDTVAIDQPSVEDPTVATSTTAEPSLAQTCNTAKDATIASSKTYMVQSSADTV